MLGSIGHLEAYPKMARLGRAPNTRELVVTGTPYIVVYRVRDEIVEVLYVLHGSRKWPVPGILD